MTRVPIIDGKTRCQSCREMKALGEFYANKSHWSGIQRRCKECCKKLDKRRATSVRRLKPRLVIQQPDDPAIRLIPLTQGQVVIVDASRYESVMQWHWFAKYNPQTRSYYAVRRGHGGEPKAVFLHRQLMDEPDGEVDHINNNSLDCRVQNLRTCTSRQNAANRGPRSNNTSGCAGVYRSNNKWQARIRVGDKRFNLGAFENLDDAIAARIAAEFKYLGEFAPSARDLSVLPLNL